MSRAKALLPAFRKLLIASSGSLKDVALCSPHLAAALRIEACSLVAAAQLPQPVCFQTFASQNFSSSSSPSLRKHEGVDGNEARQTKQEIVAAEEEFSAITDKIPQRPVTFVEGTSYTMVIVAALGFAAAVIYYAVKELLLQPKEYTCYNKILDRIKDDPRVTIRLGTPISSYGTESRNRAARQRIPHNIYNDDQGREHLQLQFHARGPSGRALVRADMYQDGKEWKYTFLYLEMEAPIPQQVVLIRPGQTDY